MPTPRCRSEAGFSQISQNGFFILDEAGFALSPSRRVLTIDFADVGNDRFEFRKIERVNFKHPRRVLPWRTTARRAAKVNLRSKLTYKASNLSGEFAPLLLREIVVAVADL